jgi:outer membrane lipoprotein SlyB
VGAIAGGLLGGLVGNNVGNGNGRTLATIVGAVGGGVLGNTIEKTQHEIIGYQINVRMEDGTMRGVHSSTLPPWRIGDAVRLSNGSIVGR